MVIISKEIRVYLSVEAFNSDLLAASFLEVSSYFPTFFDQINNVRWKTRFVDFLRKIWNPLCEAEIIFSLVYCEAIFSDIHYLRV
ncbi:hypothetical protein BpHYR1_034805 [Brachionus plicatilis]|uniref:Uncharacterized protein n=1 Tax=Brachionus plicatilis TaxID=10195 RepID=A0A3M7QDJ7_BRAPC|nr:hypothetical protein BpHYR1_034805 [Brachionus plicatilis]